MASSEASSKAEVNDTAVTTTSRNNNNNPFAREQEKREEHDAEGKNELTSPPSSSSPKISDGTKYDGEKEEEEEEKESKRDVSDISRIRFRRQSSVHDIGPIELSSTKTTVLDIKEKLKQFVTEEEQRAKKNEEKDGGKTSSITNNLTTDDIKILYLEKQYPLIKLLLSALTESTECLFISHSISLEKQPQYPTSLILMISKME